MHACSQQAPPPHAWNQSKLLLFAELLLCTSSFSLTRTPHYAFAVSAQNCLEQPDGYIMYERYDSLYNDMVSACGVVVCGEGCGEWGCLSSTCGRVKGGACDQGPGAVHREPGVLGWACVMVCCSS